MLDQIFLDFTIHQLISKAINNTYLQPIQRVVVSSVVEVYFSFY